MAIPKSFYKHEARERMHKRIKNALLAAGETPQKSKKKRPAKKGKIAKVMREFKEKELKIGKSNKKVTSPKQAIEIALNSARRAGAKISRKKNK